MNWGYLLRSFISTFIGAVVLVSGVAAIIFVAMHLPVWVGLSLLGLAGFGITWKINYDELP